MGDSISVLKLFCYLWWNWNSFCWSWKKCKFGDRKLRAVKEVSHGILYRVFNTFTNTF